MIMADSVSSEETLSVLVQEMNMDSYTEFKNV